MERALAGISASPGIVLGPVHLLRWEVPDVPQRIVPDEDVPSEIVRFHAALASAKAKLEHVRLRAERHAGAEEAAIFEVQISMLEDVELHQRVESFIRQNLGAEKAFDVVLVDWRQQFARSTSPLMRERVGDLTDVHIRANAAALRQRKCRRRDAGRPSLLR